MANTSPMGKKASARGRGEARALASFNIKPRQAETQAQASFKLKPRQASSSNPGELKLKSVWGIAV